MTPRSSCGAWRSGCPAPAGARARRSSWAGRLGRTDIRDLWTVVGMVDPGLAGQFRERLSVLDVVLTGASGTIVPLWGRYGDAERARACELMELAGCLALAGRRLAACSTGERQRALIARAQRPTRSCSPTAG